MIGSGGKWYGPVWEKIVVFAAIVGAVLALPRVLKRSKSPGTIILVIIALVVVAIMVVFHHF
jgi:hypothetical protein